MESLRELFKIGKGPSSSHTMGPERAANIIKKRFGENAEYVVDLYGSLSMTGKGHLTDYIIHETLGENCQVNFCEETLPFHPNGMVFHIYQDGELKDDITAYSVGGGSIVWEGEDDFSLSRKNVYREKNLKEILETLDGWYKVKSGPIVGYISSDPQYTATGREAKDIALQTASLKAVISTDVLNVRTEPSTDAKIWTQIVKDEKYPVIDDPETPDGWLKIDLDSVDEEDGGVSDGAYISTRDNNVEVRYVINEAIKFKPAESGSGGSGSSGSGSRRSQIVNYAIQFVGNPYVWGGTSLTNGVDCSGFTMKVMQKFGVSLPHYSGSQAKMGKKVTSGNMKPGDLIFYAGSNGRINHVALYIGNGQVVHAASRRSGIKISTWNYRSPVAIRNMLD